LPCPKCPAAGACPFSSHGAGPSPSIKESEPAKNAPQASNLVTPARRQTISIRCLKLPWQLNDNPAHTEVDTMECRPTDTGRTQLDAARFSGPF
jgi:hypothetical protein